MIEAALYTAIANAPLISALIGSRVYPLLIPQDSVLPAIDYRIVGGSSAATLTTTGPQQWRLEVNCWGSSYSDAVSLRHAVITSLNGYLDTNMSIQFLMPQDLFDDDLLQYRAVAEFYLYFNP